MIHGTDSKGERNGRCKLTAEQVRQIVSMSAQFQTHELAAQFHVDRSTIKNIKNGKRWSHVTNIPKPPRIYVYRKPSETVSKEYKQAAYDRLLEHSVKSMDGYGQEHWLWTRSISNEGYGQHMDYNRRTYAPHQVALMWKYDLAVWPKGMQTRHGYKCPRNCVNPHHLEIGTVEDQAKDRERDGTILRGSRHYNAKINEQTAKEIKQSKGSGTIKERASRFGISAGTVWGIDNGRGWNHV